MIKHILYILFIGFSASLLAHGGEDHVVPALEGSGDKKYFTVNSVSQIFELVLRYEPVEAQDPAHMIMFLSDFETNKPVDKAVIELSSLEDPSVKFSVKQVEPGLYIVETVFPLNQPYGLVANISTPDGKADLLPIEYIEVGKQLDPEDTDDKKGISFLTIFFIFLAFKIGRASC